MLRFSGLWMLNTSQRFRDVIQHGEVDFFAGVVPVNVHSKVACACPVMQTFVVVTEDVGEMINVFFSDIFDAEIVDA